MNHELLISNRTRSTPFTRRVEASGVKAYTIYNHMLLPAIFRGLEEDYWHLCEAVQLWDVSAQRQVEIMGSDAQKLLQLMTPRDISKANIGQCLYSPLCDENGYMVNDPIVIKHSQDRWWLSIADTDVLLWAKGLAIGFDLFWMHIAWRLHRHRHILRPYRVTAGEHQRVKIPDTWDIISV